MNMKNIFKVSPQKDARAVFIALVILLVIGLIANLFTGCGSDTITNNNGNPPASTTIYSLDSFSLYLNASIPTYYKDSINFSINDTSIHSIKVSFDLKTNVTTSNSSNVQFKSNSFLINSLPAIYFEIFNPRDTSYDYTFNVPDNFSIPIDARLIATLYAEQSVTTYFILRKFTVQKLS